MAMMLNDPVARWLLVGAIVALMVGCLIVGAALMARVGRQGRNLRTVERALAAREGRALPVEEAPRTPRAHIEAVTHAASDAGLRMGAGRLGDSLLADEDRRLVEACGFADVARARGLFIASRVFLVLALPLSLWMLADARWPDMGWAGISALMFFGFALGWMGPKWWLMRRWSQRRRQAGQELPLLIDLMRLLQGVGLSLDQSIHVLVHDFRVAMPVIGQELRVAAEAHTRGRTREQSLARLAEGYDNDDLTAICRLMVQIDKHGGAVQEPLARFSERVREKRKLDLKAKVAKMTVKMTGVMVMTLLPALLIVTGGSGFIAVIRGLSQIGGGSP
ncbi:type II secretion system F family protein [Bordetella genomosp. 5]|uniref:Type II secretion protein F n=1 Tax=Bordetella genomosp. 5 TaxID=1395608 RepID=A0A261TB68_9BORD|nr:type II secretion system F family protein [Bordetella genomosp. 5]OZI46531.1 type II secretion protein F [Bordetella genomosp. 5]